MVQLTQNIQFYIDTKISLITKYESIASLTQSHNANLK